MAAIYNNSYGEVLRCVGDQQPTTGSSCGTGCSSCGSSSCGGCGGGTSCYVQPANGHVIYGDNCNTGQITDTFYNNNTSKFLLGNVSNLQIRGGQQGQLLATDGYNNLYWEDVITGTVQPSINFPVAVSGNSQQFVHPNLSAFLSNAYTSVFRNGVLVQQSNYVVSGGQLTMNVPLIAGDVIDVLATGANIYVTPPGGFTTQIQFNNNGVFGGIPGATYSPATGILQIQNMSAGASLITNVLNPVNAQDAATKSYVDSVATGLNIIDPVQAVQDLPLVGSYANGANPANPGVGATYTLSSALNVADGYTLNTGDRVMIRNQSNSMVNGIYTIDATRTVLTRATDADTPAELQEGVFAFVENGATFARAGMVQIDTVAGIGNSNINFVQFSGAGVYTAANGVTLVGTSFELPVQPIVTGTYGNSTLIPVVTVDNHGIITGISTANIGIGNVGNLNLNGNANTYLDGTGNWSVFNIGNIANGTVTSVGGTGSGLGFALTGNVTTVGNLQLTVPTAVDLRTNANIGNVANLNLTGNPAQYLSGTGTWVAAASTTPPGGISTQLQYNNAGAFGGIPSATYNGLILSLGSNANVSINGGTNGQVLATNGSGLLYWTDNTGSGGGSGNISAINLNGNPSTYLNGAGSWVPVSSTTGGTVTNVATAGSGLGFSLTGGPITGSGTVQLNTPTASTLLQNIGLFGYPSLSGNGQQYLNGFGQWTVPPSSGGGGATNPAGSNTQVQFNNNGVFGATSGLTFNSSTNTLTTSNVAVQGLTGLRYGTETFGATGSTAGVVQLDVLTNSTLWGTNNASANITLAVRGSSSVTLDSLLNVYDSIVVTYYMPTGGTGYIVNAMTIDGTLVTISWINGVVPPAQNNALQVFTFQIVKTAGSTYRVLGSMARF